MARTSSEAHVIDSVRERWRARSLLVGWSVPEDWWAPAVEAVAEAAVSSPAGLARALHQLGRARGRAGAGIGETLDDLEALFGVLRWTDPPLRLVRAVAEGWVDTGLIGLGQDTCEDPLTGLVTLSYLRSRLAELYRAAEAIGASVTGSHALVMVDLTGGSPPWRRLARAMVAAHDLRRVFDAGETLALVGTGRAAALVAVRPELRPRTAELRQALEGPVRVWTEPLPATHDEAMILLDRLSSG